MPGLPLSERVVAVVAEIPTGRVLTYGDVAAILGSRAARAVGRVMRESGADLPWWRVVSARGELPADLASRAHVHYSDEGTALLGDGRVDLSGARWTVSG